MAESKTTKAKKEQAEKEAVEKEEAKAEESEQTELALGSDQGGELSIGDGFDLEAMGFDMDDLENLSGLESINADDIRVPYAKLYAKEQDGRKVGDIELPDGTIIDGKGGDALREMSILKVQNVRVYFPQPFKPSNTFICRSLDGKVGAPDGKYAGHDCSTCEFSKYPEDGGASPCREQVLILCTLPDNTLFYFLVSGIGVREFKKTFLSVEMMKGLAIVKKKLKKNVLGALNINMTVEFEDTDYGKFPKPVFRVDKEKPLVSQPRLIANLEAFQSYKEFEDEAVATAATFAQAEQGEHDNDGQAAEGENAEMF